MQQWAVILGAVLSIFGVMAAGCLMRRLNWLTEQADMSLLRLVIRVLVPCLIFSVVADNPALKEVRNLLLPPLVGFVSLAGGFAILLLFARLRPGITGLQDAKQRRTFAFSVAIYNYGYIPIPLITLLFDSTTLGVLFVHNLGVEIAFWTLGVALITGAWSRQVFRHIVNPPILAIVLSAAVNLLGWYEYVPGFLLQMIDMLGQSAIPLSLILVGAIAADHLGVLGRNAGKAAIVWACAFRLGVLPVLFLAAAYWLPASVELKRVIAIEAAMPAAVFPIVMAKHYGGDVPIAVRVAIGTSVVDLVTTPLWLSAGFALLGLGG